MEALDLLVDAQQQFHEPALSSVIYTAKDIMFDIAINRYVSYICMLLC